MVKKAKKKAAAKRKKTKVKILPKKLSSLVRLALADIRKAEKAENFVINMGDWFSPNQNVECTLHGDVVKRHKVCSVCAAGAIMAFSLGADPNGNELDPANFAGNTDQLEAVNQLRMGNAVGALHALGIWDQDGGKIKKIQNKWYSEWGNKQMPHYDAIDPEPFHKAMAEFEKDLRKAGY